MLLFALIETWSLGPSGHRHWLSLFLRATWDTETEWDYVSLGCCESQDKEPEEFMWAVASIFHAVWEEAWVELKYDKGMNEIWKLSLVREARNIGNSKATRSDDYSSEIPWFKLTAQYL